MYTRLGVEGCIDSGRVEELDGGPVDVVTESGNYETKSLRRKEGPRTSQKESSSQDMN